ncbi:MAG TPA: CBS domain-containing protein [Candidatus Acidoferrales bacterium]|nr:CBS domain-containing protein [Candidatus Acidoferrales bacterium]
MKVSELMTREVKSCALDETLNAAARIMWEHDCGCVPVLDANRRLAGIVTDRDLSMAAYTQGLPLGAIPVERAMSAQVITCAPGDSLATAHRLMRTHEVHRLPVVDSAGAIIGILSLSDLAHHARNGLAGPAAAKGQHAAEIFETVAAIRRRRPTSSAAAASKASASKRSRAKSRKTPRR